MVGLDYVYSFWSLKLLCSVKKNKVEVSFVRTLNGHDGEVTCIKASSEFSVIVSGRSISFDLFCRSCYCSLFQPCSTDRSCIIFDSNRVRFVRSLDGHLGPIVGLDIHPYTVRFRSLSFSTLTFQSFCSSLFLLFIDLVDVYSRR